MKRIGNLWEEIISYQNIILAAKNAQRSKRFRPNVLEFNYNLENEIIILKKELETQTYIPSDYKVFQIIDPKPRQISAAPYRDRVVHHALCIVYSLENDIIHILMEELSTIVITEFDTYTRFKAMAARGNVAEGLRLLDKLDQGLK